MAASGESDRNNDTLCFGLKISRVTYSVSAAYCLMFGIVLFSFFLPAEVAEQDKLVEGVLVPERPPASPLDSYHDRQDEWSPFLTISVPVKREACSSVILQDPRLLIMIAILGFARCRSRTERRAEYLFTPDFRCHGTRIRSCCVIRPITSHRH